MPIEFVDVLDRSTIQKNQDKIYVFGDNAVREGLGGQASACRNEPNTIGIRTKFAPNRRPTSYFSDDQYEVCTRMIVEDLTEIEVALMNGKTVCVPLTGFGNGLAELPDRAPRVNAFLVSECEKLFRKYGAGGPLMSNAECDMLGFRLAEHPDVLICRKPPLKKLDKVDDSVKYIPIPHQWPDDDPPSPRVA